MTKQLFLDDYIVEEMAGLKRVMHQAQKYAGKPIISPESPWEKCTGVCYLYGTVLKVGDNDFRLWYQIVDKDGKGLIAYATSYDGIHWEKPILDIYEWQGSRENNILLVGEIPCVFYEPEEADPQKRFKMFYFPGWRYLFGYAVSFSPDGLHWSGYQGKLPGGDVGHCFYDFQHNQYVATAKVYTFLNGSVRRAIGMARPLRSTGKLDEGWQPTAWTGELDEQWEPAPLVLGPDQLDDTMARGRIGAREPIIQHRNPAVNCAHFYGMPVFPYGDAYLGLLWVFDNCSSPLASGGQDGPVEVQLAFSRDLINWARIGERNPFIPLGELGQWDCGMVYTANGPVRVGDELWFYYGGFNVTHGDEVLHPPFQGIDVTGKGGAIGLAKLRVDGFVSLDAGQAGGVLVTKPFILEGKTLELNVAAKGGEMRVELLDGETGKVVPGFIKERCEPFCGDLVAYRPSWQGSSLPGQLLGRPIRLKFFLRNASLFAFRFC